MSSADGHLPTLFEPINFCDPALEAYDPRLNLVDFGAGFATPLSMQSTNDSPPREGPLIFDQPAMVHYTLKDMSPIHTDYQSHPSQGTDFGQSSDSALPQVSALGERTLSPEPLSDAWVQPWPVQEAAMQPPQRQASHASHGSQSNHSNHSSPMVSSPKTTAAQKRQAHNREVDRLLWQLKRDIPDMSWSAIASNIQACLGEAYQVPALQMRYKRLRERRQKRMATENNALLAALKHYEENKWAIIAERMNSSAMDGTWSSDWCERRWLSLELERVSSTQTPAQAQALRDDQLQTQNMAQNRQASI